MVLNCVYCTDYHLSSRHLEIQKKPNVNILCLIILQRKADLTLTPKENQKVKYDASANPS